MGRLSSTASTPNSADSERPKKKKKRQSKPVLWEVDVRNVCSEKDLEALHVRVLVLASQILA